MRLMIYSSVDYLFVNNCPLENVNEMQKIMKDNITLN